VTICAVSWLGRTTSPIAAEREQSPPASANAGQQSHRTIWTGVYSVEQAKRGELAAGRSCTKCHNADLAGGQDGPSLVGPEVVQAWSALSLGDLFERIRTTMPADAPLSLSPQDTADVLAYVLSLNRCPPGEADLPSDRSALNQIRVTNRSEGK
jgi:quinoprotein glucose dehydrogenase